MPHDQRARIPIQRLRITVQIVLGQVVERNPLRFAPQGKGPLERRPTRGGVFLRNPLGAGVIHVRIAGLGQKGRGMRDARRIGRPGHKPRGPRPQQADMRGKIPALWSRQPLIMVRPAPIIIGAPRARRQNHRDLGHGLRGPQHKQMLRLVARNGQGHSIDPAFPILRNHHLKGQGPVAARHRTLGRRFGKARGNHRLKDRFCHHPIAGNHQPRLCRARHRMQRQPLTGGIGQPARIAPDLRAGRII